MTTGDRGEMAKPSNALEALMRAASEGAAAGPRPVEKWNPTHCGSIGMAIRRDGIWMHQGSPIGRMPLVKLFASILRKDADGNTYLVTPVEKIVVDVEDAPFLAVEMAVEGEGRDQTLTFRTNVDDMVMADAAHPLRFAKQDAGGLKPYVLVRGRLEALCTRAVYAELVELTETAEAGGPGVWSGGAWFAMGG